LGPKAAIGLDGLNARRLEASDLSPKANRNRVGLAGRRKKREYPVQFAQSPMVVLGRSMRKCANRNREEVDMSDTFKVGDIVQLKSGGPNLTVKQVGSAHGGGTVRCVWFEGTKMLEEAFAPDILELAKPAPPNDGPSY
jgi:uncharacterized protein YodC (DUF2158 family)